MDWKNIVKIATLPKTIYRFNAIKIPTIIFIEIEKKNCMEHWKTLNSQRNLEKLEVSHSWFFKLHYKAIVIKTGHCWHKNIHIDHGTESRAQK